MSLYVKTLRNKIEKIKTLREFIELLIIKDYDMNSSFLKVCLLLSF